MIDKRAAAWLAWSLTAISVPLCVLSLLLGLTRVTPVAGIERFDAGEGLQYLTQWLFGAVGAVIVSRRPANRVGWIFCALGISATLGLFAYEYGVYALVTRRGSLPGGAEMAWLGRWLWAPSFGLWALALLYFPDGELPTRRWRPIAWLAVGGTALIVVAGISAWPLRGPVLVQEVPGAAGFVIGNVAIPLLLLIAIPASAISLIARFRRARGEERQQLKWLAYAAALVLVAIAGGAALTALGAGTLIASLLFTLAVRAVPVAAAIAILKYRLYDIDIIINRTLVYGALTACVVGLYVLVVGGLGMLLQARGDLLISLLATGLVAVLFAPLRDRLQRAANRLMYGERDDPYKVISRLGERLEAALEPMAVLPAIVETVAQALKLPYAAIALKEGGERDGSTIAATHGSPVDSPVRLPLVYQHEPVGELLLAPRPGEEGFSPADRRLLDDLARQAGIAAHAVRLTADLQKTRERLVNAREEERRRLRRDLHDGLGPQLSSQTLTIDAVRALMRRDPDSAEALLLDLKAQAQDAITDIRRLVYALRPPALDDLGLLGALRENAARYGQKGLRVSIEAPEHLPQLPAAVEVAVYRIAGEAITNVARHAGASECAVRLVLDEVSGALALEVRDDGRGIPEDRSTGVGFSSMRERAEELGGSLAVDTLLGRGTAVRARLPLAGKASSVGQQASGKSKDPKADI